MFKHHLFDLLKTFNEQEIKKLNEFIKSPYFNHSEKLIILFKAIKKFYPAFNDDILTKKNLHKIIYPNSNHNDSEIRSELSRLLKLTEKFLYIEKLRNDPELSSLKYPYLLKEYLSRGQKDLFNKAIKICDNSLSFSNDIFINKYKIELEKLNFSCSNEKLMKKDKLLNEINNITMAGIYLTAHFIKEIIFLYFNNVFYTIEFNFNDKENKNIGSINKLINDLKMNDLIRFANNKNKYNFILNIYFCLFKAFKNFDNESFYFKYKNLVNKHLDKLSLDEKCFHNLNMMNYCLLKTEGGKEKIKFNTELFSIYLNVFENGYYKLNGVKYLPKVLFRNVINLGLLLKEFKTVEAIIIQYHKCLAPDHQEIMMNFGYAFLYNSQNYFEKSIDSCKKIKISNIQDKYDIKLLTIKNYFGLKNFEKCFALLNNFTHFLNNENISPDYYVNSCRTFIKYLECLIINKNYKKNKLSFIYNKLLSEVNIVEKKWLIEAYKQSLNFILQD